MINSVVLVGRLTRDPELRSTSTGKQVASFGIAVDKRFKPADGSADADFFTVTAWGKTAEFCANYLTKGRLVAVEGRLSQRKYEAKDGTNRDVVEVVAENVQGLDRPRDDTQRAAVGAPRSSAPVPDEEEFDPFAMD